ncbi:hypothetical protein M3Y94_00941400 [Aphelenchoides besseyi]|nr:hypothetical protein M3Y94_00941400 [Aphelenchoides besseyi]
MVTDVFNKLTNVLTSSQYSQVMSYVAQLGITMGPAKTAMSVNTLKEVLGNNLSPIYEQLCGYAAEMKKRGMQSTGIGKETFRVINSWLTHKRANTIFTRLSARFERSDWQKIRGAFGSMFRFSKYGL